MPRPYLLLIAAALTAISLLTAYSFAQAGETANDQAVGITASRSDLMAAHNQRMLVLFGDRVAFRKYQIVDVFDQTFPVASDVPSGGRYTLREHAGTRTLVIN